MEKLSRLFSPSTRRCLLMIFLALLTINTACAPPATLAALQPVPTLQTIRLGYPPALRPWAQTAANCAAKLPGVAFFPIETQVGDAGTFEVVLAYFSDELASQEASLYEIGQDSLVLIANAANPINSLDLSATRDILAGKFADWGEVTTQPSSNAAPFTHPVKLAGYPLDDPLQASLSAALGIQLSPQAYNLPDPGAALQLVSEDPGVLGYVPETWLKDADKTTKRVEGLTVELRVLAIASTSPAQAVKALLICLQGP